MIAFDRRLDDGRRTTGWILVAVLALMFALGLAIILTGCPSTSSPKAAAFGADVKANCTSVLGSAAGDVVGQAVASAQGAPGAPTWGTFAVNELVSRGVNFAICVVEQALAVLDVKLPPAPADASGQVTAAAVDSNVRTFASGPPMVGASVARDLTAHARLVDFLAAHGVPHEHASGGAK